MNPGHLAQLNRNSASVCAHMAKACWVKAANDLDCFLVERPDVVCHTSNVSGRQPETPFGTIRVNELRFGADETGLKADDRSTANAHDLPAVLGRIGKQVADLKSRRDSLFCCARYEQ